jgi:hypothetical protein
MVIDQVIHQFHTDAEQLIPFALAVPDQNKRAELLAKASLQRELAVDMNHAIRYWLDIKQIERFHGARFRHDAFPPLIHDKLFVEFNGMLKFDFINPHQRGLGQPYHPTVRRGSIDSLFLDYDKFIREEEARVGAARNRPTRKRKKEADNGGSSPVLE